jgi:hypothetical protein
MAEKRAFVAAVLITLGLSDQFTQDMEDMTHDITGKALKKDNDRSSDRRSSGTSKANGTGTGNGTGNGADANRPSESQIKFLKDLLTSSAISEQDRAEVTAKMPTMSKVLMSKAIEWAQGLIAKAEAMEGEKGANPTSTGGTAPSSGSSSRGSTPSTTASNRSNVEDADFAIDEDGDDLLDDVSWLNDT